MGLDMYLEKHKSVEVGYWRKANQVREFFAQNLDGFQDNSLCYVPKEVLEDLVSICHRILNEKDPDKRVALAEQLLPTSSGFFFGSTEYDDGYFEDLKNTIKIVQPLIDDYDDMRARGEVLYYNEWY